MWDDAVMVVFEAVRCLEEEDEAPAAAAVAVAEEEESAVEE